MVRCSEEAFICKECGYIIDEKEMCIWTQPSTPNKVAVIMGHPIDKAPFNTCVTGKATRLENHSAGQLMHDIVHQVFYKWNYLGQCNWYELPVHYLVIPTNTEQTIPENSLHIGMVFPVESIGETVINLPTVTDFPPYGLDIYVHQSNTDCCVKIAGFSIDIYLKSRSHNVLACWCGNNVGWQISSGNYLLSPP